MPTEDLKYGDADVPGERQGCRRVRRVQGPLRLLPDEQQRARGRRRRRRQVPVSKGGLRFAVDKPLPVTLIRKLVKLRLAEIAATGH